MKILPKNKPKIKFINLTLSSIPFKISKYNFSSSCKYIYYLRKKEFFYSLENEIMSISIPLERKIKALPEIISRIQIMPDINNINNVDYIHLEIIDKKREKYDVCIESNGIFVIYKRKRLLSIENKDIELFPLIDITTKIIKNNFYFDKVINKLQNIKNSLLTYIQNEKWKNKNVNLLKFIFDIKAGIIEFNDESFNFGLSYELKINNIQNEINFQIGMFTDSIYFSITPQHFPEMIDYFINLLQKTDFLKMLASPNQILSTNVFHYNKKKFMIIYEKNSYVAINDENNEKNILFIRFNKTSDLLNKTMLIKECIKNKDTIFNLMNEQKHFILNSIDKVFKDIFKRLNILKNKPK
ncbi:MAG: hypothetical protein ACO2OX_03065 [Candidatus Nanopusillus sp.]